MSAFNVKIITTNPPTGVCRASLGGSPILAQDQEWPKCGVCGEPLVLYFQLDIEERFGLPFKAGSHLAVFHCFADGDSPMDDVYESTGDAEAYYNPQLADDYWNLFKRYHLVLNPPGITEKVLPAETRLVCRELEFEMSSGAEKHAQFKVGGMPDWIQEPQELTCGCGAAMRFLCQVPLGFRFETVPGAKESSYDFAGSLESYFFGCEAQCHPNAVWLVCQAD